MRLEITGKIKVMKYRRSCYVVEPRKLSKFGVATVTCNCKSSGVYCSRASHLGTCTSKIFYGRRRA